MFLNFFMLREVLNAAAVKKNCYIDIKIIQQNLYLAKANAYTSWEINEIIKINLSMLIQG